MGACAMNYILECESLNSVSNNVIKNKDNWVSEVSAVYAAMGKIVTCASFRGDAADSTKNYIENVHKKITDNLKKLIKLHSGNFVQFYNDMASIESDKFGRIESKEIDEISQKIGGYKKEAVAIESEIATILRGVADLRQFSKPQVKNVTDNQDSIIDLIKNINSAIRTTDSNHINSNFGITGAMITSLKMLITECRELDRDFKANFTPNSLGQISSWALVNEIEKYADEDYAFKEAQFAEAEKQTKDVAKDIKAYKEREREMAAVKFVVAGTCAIISAAVIIATAGAGTGVIVAAYAASGAITGAAGKASDILTKEYTEKGTLDNLDVGKTVKDVAGAGVTGGVTGAVSGVWPGGKTGLTKIVSKAGESVVAGMTERGISSSVDAIGDVVTGKTDFRSAVDSVNRDVYNLKDIGKDAVKGSVKAIVKQGTSAGAKKISPKLDGVLTNKKNADEYIISNSVKGSVDSTISGIANRTTSNLFDGYTASESVKKGFDINEIAKDAYSGFVSGDAGAYKGIVDEFKETNNSRVHTSANTAPTK